MIDAVPELPDLTVYIDAMREHMVGRVLAELKLYSVFVLRSVDPPADAMRGRTVVGVERLGKRLVIEVEGDAFLVIHLMVAGRLHWSDAGATKPPRQRLATFVFVDAHGSAHGSMHLDEAGKKKRASIHLVAGRAALAPHDRSGLEVEHARLEDFVARMREERHTLKRALTDPSILSGIGNAYSDEILWASRLSPFRRTDQLSDEEWQRLHGACREVLENWTQRLRDKAAGSWPRKVTAFHREMAVHGKYREPCPRCASEVQRIVYAENEANYCATCQTDGKLLADRALSTLLRGDWPRSLEELEAMRERHRPS